MIMIDLQETIEKEAVYQIFTRSLLQARCTILILHCYCVGDTNLGARQSYHLYDNTTLRFLIDHKLSYTK